LRVNTITPASSKSSSWGLHPPDSSLAPWGAGCEFRALKVDRHTFVSCPHQDQHCRHSSLLPKNGCPSRASSNDETAGRASLMSALSAGQANLILRVWAESAPQDAHGQVARSALQPHNQHNRRLLLFHWLLPFSPIHAKYDIGTLAPIQCDIGNAISCVITFETCCSL